MTSRGTRDWSGGAVPLIPPDMLGEIISTASDLSLVVSDVGRILSVLVNPDHRSFGTLSHWEGRDIRDVLTGDSLPKIEAKLAGFLQGRGDTKAIELNHHDGGEWKFPARYSFHQIGADGSVLMLGRDLRPIAEMQQQLIRAQLALERDYEQQRDVETRFRVMMESSQHAVLFVALGTGRITELNGAAAALLGGEPAELSGTQLAQELHWQGGGDLDELVAEATARDDAAVEVVATRSRRRLTLRAVTFRAAGERVALLRLTPAARRQEDLPGGLASPLHALYATGHDAIVFTDPEGAIITGNDAFLGLVDAADLPAIKGRDLGDFLARGGLDLKVLIENARRAGRMRLYSARMTSLFGSQTPVEMSATWLEDAQAPSLAFVIRDAGRSEATRAPGPAMREEDMQNVRELVGSATLKEIVLETTDVIEKMCIETALELTGNNRVAAAEMLGLSRQSLYVKLRRHNLVNRGND